MAPQIGKEVLLMAKNFNQFANEQFETLNLYTTAIVRAHGNHHPEFKDIRNAFENIQAKYNKDARADLTSEFKKLREVTNNYSAPADTCETTVASFALLKEADTLYTNA